MSIFFLHLPFFLHKFIFRVTTVAPVISALVSVTYCTIEEAIHLHLRVTNVIIRVVQSDLVGCKTPLTQFWKTLKTCCGEFVGNYETNSVFFYRSLYLNPNPGCYSF